MKRSKGICMFLALMFFVSMVYAEVPQNKKYNVLGVSLTGRQMENTCMFISMISMCYGMSAVVSRANDRDAMVGGGFLAGAGLASCAWISIYKW